MTDKKRQFQLLVLRGLGLIINIMIHRVPTPKDLQQMEEWTKHCSLYFGYPVEPNQETRK